MLHLSCYLLFISNPIVTIVLGNAEDDFVVCSLTEKDADESMIDDEKWYGKNHNVS